MNLDPESLAEMVRVARELEGRDRDDYLRDVTGGDPAQLAQIRKQLSSARPPSSIDPDAETIDDPSSGFRDPAASSSSGTADPEAPTQDRAGIPTTLRRDLFTLTEQPGSTVGRYKLLQKIGEGGFGVVYMAEQEKPVRRRVALKIIKAGMDTRQVIARFEAERQALAMMDHPYIAKVLDAGATNAGRPYFVMELVKGIPITQYCDEGKLDTRDRLALFKDICSAIQHAHHKGVIHRDLKPSNIMVTLHGGKPVVKVIDFGIAKATDQKLTEKTLFTNYGQMIGTPAYMSPEQAVMSGLDVDTRSDVYSLGVLLYELLAGRPPVDDKTLREAGFDEMRRIIREQDPPKPSTKLSTMDDILQLSIAGNRHTSPHTLSKQLRGDLDWIIMKALEKDRARRYETASAFAQDIDRYLDDRPVEAAAPTTFYRLRKYVHRHKGPVTAATVIALLLIGGSAVSAWQAVRATRAEALANQRLEETQTERDAKEQAAQDAEAIALFFTDVLRRPDPRLNGRDITVMQALDRASARVETELADQPERQARLRDVLGRTYHGLGLHDQAIIHLEQARDFFDKQLGPKHADTLGAMERLAFAYHDAGRTSEAMDLREQVLSRRSDTLSPEHADTIRAMNNLANSYFTADQQRQATDLREKVLRLSEQSLGPDHEHTLMAISNLANSYHHNQREEDALSLRERVLPMYQKAMGQKHPDTIKAMNNLANSYAHAGQTDQALLLREQAVQLSLIVLGEDHSDTFLAQENLASSYHQADRLDEARQLRERVLKLRRQINGPAHPRTLAAMNNLAISYNATDQAPRALALREEMRDLSQRAYGNRHQITLIAMHNLANSYQESDRWEDSLALRDQVLDLCEAKYGLDHAETLWAMDSLATTLSEHGQTDRAIQVYESARRQHPDDAETALKLAALYLWLDRDDDYADLRDQVLESATDRTRTLTLQQAIRLICLQPITNPSHAKDAVLLARHELDSDTAPSTSRLKHILTLGMAEYRAGQHAAALKHFDALMRTANFNANDAEPETTAVTALLFSAICRYQLGNEEPATEQFVLAQSLMKPLPPAADKPLAGLADYEALMQWLAYREAAPMFEVKPASAAR